MQINIFSFEIKNKMEYILLDETTGDKYKATIMISNVVPITSKRQRENNNHGLVGQLNKNKGRKYNKSADEYKQPRSSKRIINIESLAQLAFFNYVPSNSAACIMRFYDKDGNDSENNPKLKKNSFLVHTTGNVICPGKKEIEKIDYNFVRYLSIMKNVHQNFYRYDPMTLRVQSGYPKFLPMTRYIQKTSGISNIVATCNFPEEIVNLNEIKRCYSQYSKYYPLKFPGLDLKYKKFEKFEFSVTYIFYTTGKILILGTTSKYQVELAFKELVDIISKTNKTCLSYEKDLAWKYTYLKYGEDILNGDMDEDDKNNSRGSGKYKNDRKESYCNPEVYFVKKHGLRNFPNQKGEKTFDSTDFISRAQNIYTSWSALEPKTN